MRVVLLFAVLLCFVPGALASNLPRYTWRDVVDEARAKQLFTSYYRAASEDPKNFSLRVETAELGFYAWRVNNNNKERLEIAKLIHKLGREMIAMQPERGEGHLWVGSAIGMIGLAHGVLNSLQLIPEMKGSLEKAEKIAPTYFDGTPYSVQARLYTMLPGFPVSIGNREKARELIDKALEVAPNNVLYMLYKADLLWAQGRIAEAIAEAERVSRTEPTNLVQRFNKAVSEKKAKELVKRMKSGESRPPFNDVLSDFEQGLVD
jgi:tetratricopeptide (TPR) repeat protein